MVGEYLHRFYAPAAARGRQFSHDGYQAARQVSDWKRRVKSAWNEVAIRSLAVPARDVDFGKPVRLEVGVRLPNLTPQDVVVELLLSPQLRGGRPQSFQFMPLGPIGDGPEHRFELELEPELCGKLEYRIRVFPFHPALSHKFEMGLMKWV